LLHIKVIVMCSSRFQNGIQSCSYRFTTNKLSKYTTYLLLLWVDADVRKLDSANISESLLPHCEIDDLASLLDRGCCTMTHCSHLVHLGMSMRQDCLLSHLHKWKEEDERCGQILRSIKEEVLMNFWTQRLERTCYEVKY
jgi:hypothetical protein